MHHIYHTEALVLKGSHQGEANKVFTLYTKEFGLITATAQGIRLERSKLRFALQDFSYIRVDLVQGRDMWRITSATSMQHFSPLLKTKTATDFFSATTKLLLRIAVGERSDLEVFNEYIEVYTLLSKNESFLSDDVLKKIELILVYRVLYFLGYIQPLKETESMLQKEFNYQDIPSELLPRTILLGAINNALKESHL